MNSLMTTGQAGDSARIESTQQTAHFSRPAGQTSERSLTDRFQSRFEPDDGFRVDLADSRFGDLEKLSDFLHGELFIIIQGEDQSFLFRQHLNRPGNGLALALIHQ